MRASSAPPSLSALELARLAPLVALSLVLPALARIRPSAWPSLTRLLARRRRRVVAAPERLMSSVERALALAERLRPLSCLGRGLTRYVALRRGGLPVALAFGLGRHGEDYAGHCWVELDGEPYLEPVDPRPAFPEIYRIQ